MGVNFLSTACVHPYYFTCLGGDIKGTCNKQYCDEFELTDSLHTIILTTNFLNLKKLINYNNLISVNHFNYNFKNIKKDKRDNVDCGEITRNQCLRH